MPHEGKYGDGNFSEIINCFLKCQLTSKWLNIYIINYPL